MKCGVMFAGQTSLCVGCYDVSLCLTDDEHNKRFYLKDGVPAENSYFIH